MRHQVISIDGIFDAPAASALLKTLRGMSLAETVVLDFSHARDVYDFAVAVIAHGLATEGISARYRGLMHHQERMLHYLGFETSA
jgi:STAS domain